MFMYVVFTRALWRARFLELHGREGMTLLRHVFQSGILVQWL